MRARRETFRCHARQAPHSDRTPPCSDVQRHRPSQRDLVSTPGGTQRKQAKQGMHAARNATGSTKQRAANNPRRKCGMRQMWRYSTHARARVCGIGETVRAYDGRHTRPVCDGAHPLAWLQSLQCKPAVTRSQRVTPVRARASHTPRPASENASRKCGRANRLDNVWTRYSPGPRSVF